MLSLNALQFFLFQRYHIHFGALTEKENVILFVDRIRLNMSMSISGIIERES